MRTLIIVNSSESVPYRRALKGMLEIVDHLGCFYQVLDLSWTRISEAELKDVHLVILGQEGVGKSLSKEELSVIWRNVSNGMGLVILDGYLKWYEGSFLKSISVEIQPEGKTACLKLDPAEWICQNSARYEVELKQPITCHFFRDSAGVWKPFLFSEEHEAVGAAASFGKGRVVLFSVSAGVWQDEYLGHTEGLDGLFCRSLVWAARKPFVLKAMPPFTVIRVDDVSGSGSPVAAFPETVGKLRWLDVLNQYGFLPNAGLFLDDIKPDDTFVIREKYREKMAEFSPHAFRDPENTNAFPVYLQHNGEEIPKAELQRNFEKVDRKFADWGVKPSQTVNVHFGELGLNCFPFLKERNQRYLMNVCRAGKAYADPKAHQWDLKPYGKIGFSMDWIPEDRQIFQVLSLPGTGTSSQIPEFDFLFGCTTFWKENTHTDVDRAIARGVFQIRRGLENMFFGCLTTHEQRISHISLEDWSRIIRGIVSDLKDVPHIFKSYDYISAYAENRLRYEIAGVEQEGEITIYLKGESKMPQFLYLFQAEIGGIKQSFLEVPAFEKAVEVTFRPKTG